ncbi:amidohydrolase family protein [Staphylococcus kloosii]|jgi:cytosine deaminase|uniref:Cytosine deaminase n=1 Tax=Staphylococcus kloosii TaxID=29384 RepID=A0ABQ0XI94_9STAP|nr:amidohydrolase family protein [Staphylococcus kloosii]AVQ35035.1 cytosine deaminase [Staphylococcus kloosii]PNZ08538.1 cytosine deaminase [Staphylococcus kloosii]GEP81173.1 cytosine deaminase [Staphylococcus kloosii]SUM48071.1 imidazolonepropionase [Staphylococcus kloosii]
MKKFINATIYGVPDATEFIIDDNGQFKAVGNNLEEVNEAIDLEGRLVLPPFVDPHVHLDYIFTGLGEGNANVSGTLFEGIQRWSDNKKELTEEVVRERALAGIRKEMNKGVQFIRTHVDITDPDLTGMKAMLKLRDELKDYVTIQLVAFPQEGFFRFEGAEQLMEKALEMGADVAGGIPHFEISYEHGVESLRRIIAMAKKYNTQIDIHCDENDDPNSRFLEVLNALVMEENYGQYTTASHTCSFGAVENSYANKMMGLFRESKINFIVCPTENMHLQGRGDNYPVRRGITRVKELLNNGNNLAFAQDSIADYFYPLGNGNMMNILDNGIHLAHYTHIDEINKALDLITYNSANILRVNEQYGIEEGKPANFIVIDAQDAYEAVRERAEVITSVRNGEYIFKRAPRKNDIEIDFLKN